MNHIGCFEAGWVRSACGEQAVAATSGRGVQTAETWR